MLDFSRAQLAAVVFHKIGTKAKGDESFFSKELFTPSEDLTQSLLEYFLLPFRSINDQYKFHHSSSLDYNEVYNYARKSFERSNTFLNRSVDIAKHLYDQSEHPGIKSGELAIVLFTNVIYETQEMDAIGIYKSERKDTFFQFKKGEEKLTVSTSQGVNAKKLDKAALIVNADLDDGLRVFCIDNNNYDTEYWKDKFLNITDARDANYQTKNYIGLCKSFSAEVIEPSLGRREGIAFLNHSLKYMQDNESLELDDFANTVLRDQGLEKDFKKYKRTFEKENDVAIEEDFEISKPTLRQQKKKIKSEITLDTQIQIKLGPTATENGEEFIERGYDEKRKMFFYKVFFNNETD